MVHFPKFDIATVSASTIFDNEPEFINDNSALLLIFSANISGVLNSIYADLIVDRVLSRVLMRFRYVSSLKSVWISDFANKF